MDDDSAAGSQPGRTRDAWDTWSETPEALRLRETVSALMDGEAPAGAPRESWAQTAHDPEARSAWLRYHQVGDCLRSADLNGAFDEAAFLRRFGERLRDEPVRIAPDAMRGRGEPSWWRATPWAGALAAALAGLATVALLGDMPQRSEPWIAPEAAQEALAASSTWNPGPGSAGAGTNALRIGLRGDRVALNGRSALLARPICISPARSRGSSAARSASPARAMP